jgi:pyruvate,water dikinase
MKLLSDDLPEPEYGGKAAGLSKLIRAHDEHVKVPRGYALAWDEQLRGGDFPGIWAVRSSAIGEDSSSTSFAGQHDTLLNVPGETVPSAVERVRESVNNPRVLAYRRKHGLDGIPQMGVVIQRMVFNVRVSAVAFTKDPQDECDDVYIEYTPGLGDRLVSGKVTPKDITIRRSEFNEMELHWAWLVNLAKTAIRCERIIGGYADVEAAYNGNWWVCQARRITT